MQAYTHGDKSLAAQLELPDWQDSPKLFVKIIKSINLAFCLFYIAQNDCLLNLSNLLLFWLFLKCGNLINFNRMAKFVIHVFTNIVKSINLVFHPLYSSW